MKGKARTAIEAGEAETGRDHDAHDHRAGWKVEP
jgi:hypothetical protein